MKALVCEMCGGNDLEISFFKSFAFFETGDV